MSNNEYEQQQFWNDNLKTLLEIRESWKKNYTSKGRRIPILHIINLENKIKELENGNK